MVDARGFSCPMPVVMTKKRLKRQRLHSLRLWLIIKYPLKMLQGLHKISDTVWRWLRKERILNLNLRNDDCLIYTIILYTGLTGLLSVLYIKAIWRF